MSQPRAKVAVAPSAIDTNVVKLPSRPSSALGKSRIKATPLRARVDVGRPSMSRTSTEPNAKTPTSPLSSIPRMRKISSQLSLRRSVVQGAPTPPTSTSSQHSYSAHSSPRTTTLDGTGKRHGVKDRRSSVSLDLDSWSMGEPAPTSLLPAPRIVPSAQPSPGWDTSSSFHDRPVRAPINSSPRGYPSSPQSAHRRPLSAMGVIRATPIRSYPDQDSPQPFTSPHSPSVETRRLNVPTSSPERRPTTSMDRSRPLRATVAPSNPSMARGKSQPTVVPSPNVILAPDPIEDLSHSVSDLNTRSIVAASTPVSNNIAFPATAGLSDETSRDISDIMDAKHARKILDLEISNKSLLAVNAALEASKVKMTKELRILRQQLVMEKVDATQSEDPLGLDGLHASLADMWENRRTSDKWSLGGEVLQVLKRQDQELSESHERCREMIDTLLEEARTALLSQPSGVEKHTCKVLHASDLPNYDDENDDNVTASGDWNSSSSDVM